MVVLVVVLALGTTEAAAHRVAVLREGRGGAGAVAAITIALERRHEVISEAAAQRARKKIRSAGQEGRARLASSLGADALVVVSVGGRGRKHALEVKVYEGSFGELIEDVRVPLRGRDTDAEAEQRATLDVMAALTRLPKGDTGGGDEPAGAPVAAAAPVPAAEEPAPIEARKAAPPPAAGGPADEEAPASSGLALHAGLGFTRRSFAFEVPQGGMPQQNYKGNPVAGLNLQAELYPLALLGRSGAARGFGVYLRFDRTFALTSQLEGTTETFSSSLAQAAFGLLWRFELGSSATSPSLGVRAGAGSLEFAIADTTGRVRIPAVEYAFLDLGAFGRVPLGSEAIALVVGLDYLPTLSAGAIADPARNRIGGTGSASGLGAEGGVEGRPARWLTLRATVRWQRFAHTFAAAGGATLLATGATDDYLGGTLTAGVVF